MNMAVVHIKHNGDHHILGTCIGKHSVPLLPIGNIEARKIETWMKKIFGIFRGPAAIFWFRLPYPWKIRARNFQLMPVPGVDPAPLSDLVPKIPRLKLLVLNAGYLGGVPRLRTLARSAKLVTSISIWP
jgi:hypothetical protein